MTAERSVVKTEFGDGPPGFTEHAISREVSAKKRQRPIEPRQQQEAGPVAVIATLPWRAPTGTPKKNENQGKRDP